jgi:enoyl-CoA hydratase/carnithine racemase
MSDIDIRIDGRAGRITLTRPKALNALTYEMCLAVDAALRTWADDPVVDLVLIDAEGRAFCAGGDIAEMYATGTRGDFDYGRRFWRDEYRMNARIAEYPKPVVALMQGYTMGGGVGIGCHANHRVVGESCRIAMPECSIGLVPDVGGSLILRRAPGAYGIWAGLTGARLGAAEAIAMGFADRFARETEWPALTAALLEGDLTALPDDPPPAPALPDADEIAAVFGQPDLQSVRRALDGATGDWADDARKAMAYNSPLSMACALAMQRELAPGATIRDALRLEYRATSRSAEKGDFLEGIRARIIDRDNLPGWRPYAPGDEAAMLAPLGPSELTFTED